MRVSVFLLLLAWPAKAQIPPLFAPSPPALIPSPAPEALFPPSIVAPPSPVGRVVGRVLSETGQPVAGAQIAVGSGAAATTDARGNFELNYNQPGRWSLTTSHPSYEPLKTPVWIQMGLTTPVDIILRTAMQPQPRTRLGVLGVGGLENTQQLAQRLTGEVLRLGLIPQVETVVPLDNSKLQPLLRRVGLPLYELFEIDRQKPEAVKQFFDLMGLKAIVIARVDVLTRPASATEISLRSRSRLELWELTEQGQLQVRTLDEAGRSQNEKNNANATEMSQLFQIQVTQMAEEMRDRWQKGNPLAAFFDPNRPLLSPQPSQIDTNVELRIPQTPAITPSPSPRPGSG